MELLIGADPEFFVRQGGKYVSAYNMIAGTKEEPFPVMNGAVQVDGNALEINITPAARSADFIYNLNTVMTQLKGMISSDCTIEIVPAVKFDPEYMATLPAEALRLGCDPDFNAYEKKTNPSPNAASNLRTAAGHIHVGWCQDVEKFSIEHFDACCTLVKQLDFFLGLVSTILDPDTERKQMYGKAGAFRPKSYGVEYRVLSNFWMEDDKLKELVFNNTKMAFEWLTNGIFLGTDYGDICQQIINSNDRVRAINLCNSIGIPYKPYNWDEFRL